MKNLNYLFLFVGMFLVNACSESVVETVTYKMNEPVFLSTAEFRSSVKVTAPIPITKQGKICYYKGYLFISEPEKGVHIVNNTDPAKPKVVGFIELLGNADLAIRNDVLYADSYIDLVWFDITDPSKPVLKGRKEEVFPVALPATNNFYGYDYAKCMDRKNGIVVGWTVAEHTEMVTRDSRPFWYDWGWGMKDGAYTANSPASGGANVGAVGSMSRFMVYKNYLYTVMNNYMTIFDLRSQVTDIPEKIGENIYIGWNVETIFNYKDNMFLGTPQGMIIYSVADPVKPERLASISHIMGCDPVVVENDIAYVTIRSGNFCGQNSNQLLVYNVADPRQPKHIVTYEMKNPKGLGIDNGTLFLCDEGLKVYDATNPLLLMGARLAHYTGMDGFDVIPFNHVLMMIANDGIYQYDYTDVKNIKQLSKLPIGK